MTTNSTVDVPVVVYPDPDVAALLADIALYAETPSTAFVELDDFFEALD